LTVKKTKIINDPVHGFLSFPEPEIMLLADHPWFQRLRNIMQMGVAHLVYPGAVHTRFLHSLGACHMMGQALDELVTKGVDISYEERLAARQAILLHDVGHGPFSHALEHSLIKGISHEQLSRIIIQRLNKAHGGILDNALQVFDFSHPRLFLHQLVSSQLDMDRLDYLSRDSFYSGVSEGVIGYDRILKMLTVYNNELAVEEKGVSSVEKFIIARRLMYWQVYLHKTVLGAELLLVNILKRAKELAASGMVLPATPALQFFLSHDVTLQELEQDDDVIGRFCQLDDTDIITAVKMWQTHDEPVLAMLCNMFQQRRLYKVVFDPADEQGLIQEQAQKIRRQLGVSDAEMHYFVFSGETSNSTYNAQDSRINIAMKDGTLRDISEVEHSLVNQTLAIPVTKRFVCYRKCL
jgi:HD superfamily phosphohydrolase